MSLSETIKDKKASDFSKDELIALATENKVEFTPETTEEEIFASLVNAVKPAKKPSKNKVKVKFLKSPTGEYKLAYNAGDTASLPESQATTLVEDKFAEFVK